MLLLHKQSIVRTAATRIRPQAADALSSCVAQFSSAAVLLYFKCTNDVNILWVDKSPLAVKHFSAELDMYVIDSGRCESNSVQEESF